MTMAGFCETVSSVIDSLPADFRKHLENVAVDVHARPSARILRQQGHSSRSWRSMLGYFEGRPLTVQQYGEHYPNRITLFKESIEAMSRSVAEIRYEIRRTLIHELAHHFGFSEDDLEDFEAIDSPFDEPEPTEEP